MNILHIALIFVYFILWQHSTTQVMKDEQLFLPVSVVREWQDHGTCGPQFKAWMDKFLTNHGKLIDPEEEKKKEEESNKRSGDGQTSGPSPKKPRIEAADLISKEHYLTATEIQQPLIQEVKLEKSMPTVHLRGGDTAFLVNMSDKEWTGCHPCIAMFGNGTYKILKEGQEGNEKSIELQFASSEDLVILGGSMQKLGQVLKDMREEARLSNLLLSGCRGPAVHRWFHIETDSQGDFPEKRWRRRPDRQAQPWHEIAIQVFASPQSYLARPLDNERSFSCEACLSRFGSSESSRW